MSLVSDTEQYLCREELHNHFPAPPGPGDQLARQSLDSTLRFICESNSRNGKPCSVTK